MCLFIVARVEIASVRLIFWDLGGQEDLQNLWDKVRWGQRLALICMWPFQYYSECHGVIYVVDSCDADNLSVSSETFSKQWNLPNSYDVTVVVFTHSQRMSSSILTWKALHF